MIVRNISIMMMTSMLMAVFMVIMVTLWTVYENNRSAAADSNIMVRGGFEARVERLASLNFDYSVWNAAYEAALARDVEWMSENMGSGTNETEFNVLQVVSVDDWSSLTWTAERNAEELGPTTEPFVPIELVRSIYPALQEFERDAQDTQTTFAKIDGTLYAVSVSRLQPLGGSADRPPETFPLNVFALRLDEVFLSDLRETYLLEDMAFTDERPTEGSSLPLDSVTESEIAFLSWTPPRPGDTLVRTASLPIGLGLAVFLALTGRVMVTARRNASKLVESEAQATRIARVDVMTGLPNRLALNERFADLRGKEETLCTLILDLNGFKTVNDKFGHAVGDEYIRRFSRLVTEHVGPEGFAARLGGDEFAILFHGEDAEEQCLRFCSALREASRAPFEIQQISLDVAYAAGFSIGTLKEVRTGELLRQSDIAMYYAKNGRKREPVKYDPRLEQDKIEEERMIAALGDALVDCREFEIVYQPVVDARTGALAFAEALIRWNSPVLGSVSPAYFIPIAERTSLIAPLGRFVIERVFSDLAQIGDMGVSINLSPAQLKSTRIAEEICDLADAHAIAPSQVTFEITETTFLEDENVISFICDALRDKGFKIALDDFGTGYSSIGYLRKMKFDKLKVDKSFIDDIGVTETGENLLTSLCFLSRALGLQIVAEGVETENQFTLLHRLSYDLVQGYYFSQPMPVTELKDIVDRGHEWSELVGSADAA